MNIMRGLLLAGVLSVMQPESTLAEDFAFDEMTYSQSKTVFKLFAPRSAKQVVVRIYNDGAGGTALKTVHMAHQGNDIWRATVKGDLKGKFYTFDMGRGETPGVFAQAVGVNGKRGAILQKNKTEKTWDLQRPIVRNPADLVVYEMHHRDFSIARKNARYPGKFLALTEPWAIAHLKELGVNAVHILPSYDFGSVDETRLDEPQYNWGYDPVNYNVPEGSYATDPYDPACRINEFKQMVEALHKAGICVILDVVYNHTYDIEHSNFQRTFPDYYYRMSPVTEDEGSLDDNKITMTTRMGYSNGSGCGNETASERPMMRRFMIESVKYWVREYHIDGFRFDLMGCHDIETMNEIRKALDEIDPTIFVYGEGWSAGSCALPNDRLGMKANMQQMPGIAAFSDDLRDALRGPFSDDTKCGWLGGATQDKEVESLKAGIAGMISHPQVDYTKVNYSKEPYATEPTQMMAYVSCHDDMCLVDRLMASIPSLQPYQKTPLENLEPMVVDELIRLDLLAQTAVFTSQGVPFMLAGEELLRTKKGVHNSFESPDEINHLDWKNKQRFPQVMAYYKGLIALRKNHPAFRLGSADLVRKHLEFLDAPEGMVVFRLKNYAGRDEWRNIIVVLNAFGSEKAKVSIPYGKYTVVGNGKDIEEHGLSTFTGSSISVPRQTAYIIHD